MTAERTPSPVPRWAVIGIFVLLAFGAITYAQSFLMPVVLAFLLALIFSPVRRALERLRVAPGIAAAGIVVMLVTALLVIVVTLATPVASLVDDGPRIAAEIQQKLADLRGAAEDVTEVAAQVDQIAQGGGAGEAAEDAAAATGAEAPERVVVEERGAAMSIAMTAPGVLAQFVLTLVLLFFLLASGDMFYEKIVHVIPRFSDKRRAVRIAYDIERRLSRYLLTITIINAGLGLSIGLAMWAIGMPTPLMFGVIGFLFNFVPYVGAVAGVLIATAVAVVSLDTIGMALATGAVYFLCTAVEGQFVTPYFVGRSLRLNVVVVFISVTLWGVAVVGGRHAGGDPGAGDDPHAVRAHPGARALWRLPVRARPRGGDARRRSRPGRGRDPGEGGSGRVGRAAPPGGRPDLRPALGQRARAPRPGGAEPRLRAARGSGASPGSPGAAPSALVVGLAEILDLLRRGLALVARTPVLVGHAVEGLAAPPSRPISTPRSAAAS